MKMKRYTKESVINNRFYQMPKFLFEEDFKKLSNDAKVLYSLLRDRHDLSLDNNWTNENDEIFLIFTREHMAEMLGCSVPTARKAFKQLEDFGLVEDEFQGLNKPNLIYLFEVSLNSERTERIFHAGRKDTFTQDKKNLSPNDTDINKTDINKTDYNNDNGVLPNGKNSTNAFPNSEIVSAISKYMNGLYVEKTGKKHPHLKPEQYKRVYDTLDSFCNENAVDESGLVSMMIAFLNSDIDSDWNINHFATEGILMNRFYEELY